MYKNAFKCLQNCLKLQWKPRSDGKSHINNCFTVYEGILFLNKGYLTKPFWKNMSKYTIQFAHVWSLFISSSTKNKSAR